MSLLFAGGLWACGWFYGAQKIRTALDEKIQFHQHHSHAQITHQGMEIGGFPFGFHIKIKSPSVKISHGHFHQFTATWEGEGLHFHLYPWNWKELKGRLEGAHHMRVFTGTPLTSLVELHLHDAGLVASLTRRGRLSEGTLTGIQAQVVVKNNPYPTLIDQGQITLYRGTQVSDQKRRAMWGTKIQCHGVHLPILPLTPLGQTIQEVSIDSFLLKPDLPFRDWADFLQAWREEEGALELNRCHLSWGPVTLGLNGTLSVDQNLRPMGSMSASVSGFAEAIDALVTNGIMDKGDGRVGKLALSLLANQENKEGPPSVSLPITAQDGRLTVGPLMFMPLPSTLELVEGRK
jgi:hypothetical protein